MVITASLGGCSVNGCKQVIIIYRIHSVEARGWLTLIMYHISLNRLKILPTFTIYVYCVKIKENMKLQLSCAMVAMVNENHVGTCVQYLLYSEIHEPHINYSVINNMVIQ